MEVEPNQKQLQTENLQGIWASIQRSKGGDSPRPRFNHIAFIYKNYIYIHGGTGDNQNSINDQANVIFRMSMDTKHWQKIQFNRQQSAFQSGSGLQQPLALEQLSAHCGVVYKDQLIIFGGSNSKMECKNDLLSLNLQTHMIKSLQQKGDIPSPRQSAAMLLYKNEWLILFGGISFNSQDLLNEFRFYNLLTKTWIKVQGSYEYLIQARFLPALALVSDRMYLFGGQYYNSFGENKFLDDFYQITPTVKSRSSIVSIQVTRILSHTTPSSRSGHSLSSLGNNHLVLIGGENFYTEKDNTGNQKQLCTRNDVWIYNIKAKQWFKIQPKGDSFKFRACFTACQKSQKRKIYVFGGMKKQDLALNDMMCLDLENADLQALLDKNRVQAQKECRICYQNKNHMVLPQFRLDEEALQTILNTIEFPFSAFGLIFDNFILTGTTLVNIYFEQSVKGNYLRIEDNGKVPFSDQFVHSLINFDMGVNIASQGVDKKMRYIMTKDAQRKQMGVNLKAGALRIGNQFLYINVLSNQECRVTWFVKQTTSNSSNKKQLVCYHYAFNPVSNQVLKGHSAAIKKRVEQKHESFLKQVREKIAVKNILLIFQLKQVCVFKENSKESIVVSQPQLYPDVQQNDIIYGNRATIKSLKEAGYNIYECCDISLRSYLTYLFVKNQSLKVFMGLRGKQRRQIINQAYLQKIDKMARNKVIIDLEGVMDYDCKIVELYYNPDTKQRVGGFHNGVLIYHKGRLVSRFKYKLGELLEMTVREDYKSKLNLVNLFGYIDVPEVVPINMFKTDFVYNIMMEKLYSRIKFISRYLDKKNSVIGGIKYSIKKLQQSQRKQVVPSSRPDQRRSNLEERRSKKQENQKVYTLHIQNKPQTHSINLEKSVKQKMEEQVSLLNQIKREDQQQQINYKQSGSKKPLDEKNIDLQVVFQQNFALSLASNKKNTVQVMLDQSEQDKQTVKHNGDNQKQKDNNLQMSEQKRVSAVFMKQKISQIKLNVDPHLGVNIVTKNYDSKHDQKERKPENQ